MMLLRRTGHTAFLVGVLTTLCIMVIAWIWLLDRVNYLVLVPPYKSFHSHLNTSSNNTQEKQQENEKFLKLLTWPEPPNSTSFESSTSPKTTKYSLLDPKTEYQVGQSVKISIRAHDHYGNPKTYGGDYFQAKLHSPQLRAGVTGSITDHRNGTYTATFLLLWPGVTQISVLLAHSSEAIAILKRRRQGPIDLIYYVGYFLHHNGSSTRVVCGVRPPGQDVCTYRDAGTGEEWFCVRPQGYPCSAYREHHGGGNRKIFTASENQFLQWSVVNQEIPSTLPSITVLPLKNTTDERVTCRTGLSDPDPSGFYHMDTWHSRVCRNRRFPKPSDVASCLKGKAVYMFGDSTVRQWWEYLVDFIPSLQYVDLHVFKGYSNLLAVDSINGFLVYWRMHEKPLTTGYKHLIPELRYIANELDQIGGEQDGTIVIINCMAHFIMFPVEVYLRRILTIRDAVARLLERRPNTLVIIKTGNTGYIYTYGSDWLSLQLDTLMRAVFAELPVTVLDAWQMTSCHYLPKKLHPGHVIVQNMVDFMLSYVCPA